MPRAGLPHWPLRAAQAACVYRHRLIYLFHVHKYPQSTPLPRPVCNSRRSRVQTPEGLHTRWHRHDYGPLLIRVCSINFSNSSLETVSLTWHLHRVLNAAQTLER